MKKSCLIIAGGELDIKFASCYIKKKYGRELPDMVIAVDRGLEGVKQLGILPHILLGDYDSVKSEVLKEYEEVPQVTCLRYPPEKDYTDSHLAIEKAIQEKATDICILGATGTRMDHSLANMGLLWLCMKAGIKAELVDAHNRIRMMEHRLEIQKEEQFGKYVSLLPYTEYATGITLTGFQYPLYKDTLSMGISRGISNEIINDVAVIEIETGILYVIESKD